MYHAFLLATFYVFLNTFNLYGDASSTTESNPFSSFKDMAMPSYNSSSVYFFLYTPENPVNGCLIKPEASVFDKCCFNPSYDTKFVIHGYQVKLSPGNQFEKIKDTLLKYDDFNVILVNWTKYNQQDYAQSMYHAYQVGGDVGDMVNFIISHTGVNASSIHLIGHSLGAHISGVGGKKVKDLARITGLDPAGPLYTIPVTFNRLTSTDAVLVDAIHTSSSDTGYGFGMFFPMARINFYPNSGERQPLCEMGMTFADGDGQESKILDPVHQAICFHSTSVQYFISSISDCEYISVECDDYASYKLGSCKQHEKNKMGFHCTDTKDHKSYMFYLDTSETSPYC